MRTAVQRLTLWQGRAASVMQTARLSHLHWHCHHPQVSAWDNPLYRVSDMQAFFAAAGVRGGLTPKSLNNSLASGHWTHIFSHFILSINDGSHGRWNRRLCVSSTYQPQRPVLAQGAMAVVLFPVPIQFLTVTASSLPFPQSSRHPSMGIVNSCNSFRKLNRRVCKWAHTPL